MFTKAWKAMLIVTCALALVALVVGGLALADLALQTTGVGAPSTPAATAIAVKPQSADRTSTVYFEQGGNKLVVDSGGTVQVNSGGALTSSGSTTLGAVTFTSATVSGAEAVGTFLKLTPQGTLVVTNTVFTPTGTYQPISSTTSVTPVLSVDTGTYAAGSLLRLVNVGGYTVTITDSTTAKLSGTLAMSTTDALLLMFDGTAWFETARSPNH